MKCCNCWSHCSILLRIPITSDRSFITCFTRRCVARWMCLVTSLGASSFAFWATKTTRKSLIVWQRWRSFIARGVVTGPLLCPLITGEMGGAIPAISQEILGKPFKVGFIVVSKATSRNDVIPGKEISPCRRRMERLGQPQSNEWPLP